MRYQEKQQHHFGSLIAIILIVAAGFGVYQYFSINNAHAQADPLVAPDATGSATEPAPLSQEQEALLAKIEGIKLDGSLLQDQYFLGLQDYTVELGHQAAGRPNPFAPYSGAPVSK